METGTDNSNIPTTQSIADNVQTQDGTLTQSMDQQTTKAVFPTTDSTLAPTTSFTIRAKVQEKSPKLLSTQDSNFSTISSTVVPGNKIENKIITHVVNAIGLVDAELALQNHYTLLTTLDATYTVTILDTISSITSPNVVIDGSSDDTSVGDGNLLTGTDNNLIDSITSQTQSNSADGDTLIDNTPPDTGDN